MTSTDTTPKSATITTIKPIAGLKLTDKSEFPMVLKTIKNDYLKITLNPLLQISLTSKKANKNHSHEPVTNFSYFTKPLKTDTTQKKLKKNRKTTTTTQPPPQTTTTLTSTKYTRPVIYLTEANLKSYLSPSFSVNELNRKLDFLNLTAGLNHSQYMGAISEVINEANGQNKLEFLTEVSNRSANDPKLSKTGNLI